MTDVVIWGCGGFGREVNMLCGQAGLHVRGFLDERPEMKGRAVDDVPVLGTVRDIAHLRASVSIVCAGVGDPALKQRFARLTAEAGFRIAGPVVHPGVHVSPRTTLGRGTVVCAGVVMTVNVRVGEHVILNLNSTLGHDVVVGSFVTIAPGVNVSGRVTIDEGAYLGTNCAILEGRRLGAFSMVGGGSFVRTDVPERALFAGVPAVLKKQLP